MRCLRGRGGEGELVDSEGRSLRPFTVWQGFVLGWVCGFLWWLGTCYWIFPVMHDYGNLNVAISALLMFGLSAYMALNHAIFCAPGCAHGPAIVFGQPATVVSGPVFLGGSGDYFAIE